MLLQIGPEKFRAPEVLFRPEIIGSESGGSVYACREVFSDRRLMSDLRLQACRTAWCRPS